MPKYKPVASRIGERLLTAKGRLFELVQQRIDEGKPEKEIINELVKTHNLSKANIEEIEKTFFKKKATITYKVVDNAFNRGNYSDLVGKELERAPAYANVMEVGDWDDIPEEKKPTAFENLLKFTGFSENEYTDAEKAQLLKYWVHGYRYNMHTLTPEVTKKTAAWGNETKLFDELGGWFNNKLISSEEYQVIYRRLEYLSRLEETGNITSEDAEKRLHAYMEPLRERVKGRTKESTTDIVEDGYTTPLMDIYERIDGWIYDQLKLQEKDFSIDDAPLISKLKSYYGFDIDDDAEQLLKKFYESAGGKEALTIDSIPRKYFKGSTVLAEIRKSPGKKEWKVFTEKGKPMGTYDSVGDAEERIQQMETFKHLKSFILGAKYNRKLTIVFYSNDINSISDFILELGGIEDTHIVSKDVKNVNNKESKAVLDVETMDSMLPSIQRCVDKYNTTIPTNKIINNDISVVKIVNAQDFSNTKIGDEVLVGDELGEVITNTDIEMTIKLPSGEKKIPKIPNDFNY